MEGEYDVFLEEQPVGRVRVTREGLYLRFLCRCVLPGGQVYRLVVFYGGTSQRLGVPVPGEEGFSLDTRLPAKRFSGTLSFRLYPRREEAGSFIPVVPGRPFAYMTRLRQARFDCREGVPGIVLPPQS